MAYDSECWNLAQHFLTGEGIPSDKEDEATGLLAQAIQVCVEDWIKYDLPGVVGTGEGIKE